MWSIFVFKVKKELTNNKMSKSLVVFAFLFHAILMPVSIITAIKIIRQVIEENFAVNDAVIVVPFSFLNKTLYYRHCTIVMNRIFDLTQALEVINKVHHYKCCFVCEGVEFTDLNNESCLMSTTTYKFTNATRS